MAITLSDFNKIWASSSPLTPYSFSDSNYEEGWNFVGSTPPARQMWDSYMKLNDEKSQWLYQQLSPIGTQKTDTKSTTVSVPSTTAVNVASVNIEAGTWVVTGHIKFDSVIADTLYACGLSGSNSSVNLANDGTTSVHSSNTSFIGLQVVRVFKVIANTDVYLNVYATASCTVTNAQIEAIQIR